MYTVAVISQKGGAGKTTLALHLAVASEHAGKSAAIVDLDPQASASRWKDRRQGSPPAVVSSHASRLLEVLQAAREHGAELAIIDTAPHSETSALNAARAADLILIPCRPSILDLQAISTTVDIARLANKTAFAVLNHIPPRGTMGEEARAAIALYGLPIAPAQLVQRNAFVHSLTEGLTAQEYEPEGKAAQEIRDLFSWLCEHANLLA